MSQPAVVSTSPADPPRQQAGAIQHSPAQSGQAGAIAPASVDGKSALLALLRLEAEAREVKNERELKVLIVNETRKLTRARQIFLLIQNRTGQHEVVAVSSIPTVDRNAPLVAWIEGNVERAHDGDKLGEMKTLEFRADDPTASAYPFQNLLWVPLAHGDAPAIGGMVLAREDVWQDGDKVVAKRLAGTFAHAWNALRNNSIRKSLSFLKFRRWALGASLAVIALLFFVSVPMSAIAPVEVVPTSPFVVTAPIDGVIKEVVVDANQSVKKGDILVRLSDTKLRNALEVAEREVLVAEAQLKRVNQLAFDDPNGMHELGIARSELAVKLAERDFAREMLSKSVIRAERDGLAIYGDKRELTGKPVSIGERILEVSESNDVQAKILLPVSDAITLTSDSRVKMFLDSDPLNPWSADIKHADYKARPAENNVVAFRIIANIRKEDETRPLPRMGVRGTALVTGEKVPLGLYLFRRPIMALRQWLGW